MKRRNTEKNTLNLELLHTKVIQGKRIIQGKRFKQIFLIMRCVIMVWKRGGWRLST